MDRCRAAVEPARAAGAVHADDRAPRARTRSSTSSSPRCPRLVQLPPIGVHLDGAGWEPLARHAPADTRRPGRTAAARASARRPGGRWTWCGEAWAWALPAAQPRGAIGTSWSPAEPSRPPPTCCCCARSRSRPGSRWPTPGCTPRKQAANAELPRTVRDLRDKTAIHDRFTQVAADRRRAGRHRPALHELTGLPACIEDRRGDVLAWAGPEAGRRPDARPGRPTATRREHGGAASACSRAGHPIRVRIAGRLLTVARPRADVVGVLCLVDPTSGAGEAGDRRPRARRTVLAIELARLHSLAETELRLGRDLVADLVAGHDARARHRRAEALGHDLGAARTGWSSSGPRGHGASRTPWCAPSAASLSGTTGPRPADAAGRAPSWRSSRCADAGPDPSCPAWRPGCAPRSAAGRCPRGRRGLPRAGGLPPVVPRGPARAAAGPERRGRARGRRGLRRPRGLPAAGRGAPTRVASTRSCDRWLGPLLDYDEPRRGRSLVLTLAHFLDCGGPLRRHRRRPSRSGAARCATGSRGSAS